METVLTLSKTPDVRKYGHGERDRNKRQSLVCYWQHLATTWQVWSTVDDECDRQSGRPSSTVDHTRRPAVYTAPWSTSIGREAASRESLGVSWYLPLNVKNAYSVCCGFALQTCIFDSEIAYILPVQCSFLCAVCLRASTPENIQFKRWMYDCVELSTVLLAQVKLGSVFCWLICFRIHETALLNLKSNSVR